MSFREYYLLNMTLFAAYAECCHLPQNIIVKPMKFNLLVRKHTHVCQQPGSESSGVLTHWFPFPVDQSEWVNQAIGHYSNAWNPPTSCCLTGPASFAKSALKPSSMSLSWSTGCHRNNTLFSSKTSQDASSTVKNKQIKLTSSGTSAEISSSSSL